MIFFQTMLGHVFANHDCFFCRKEFILLIGIFVKMFLSNIAKNQIILVFDPFIHYLKQTEQNFTHENFKTWICSGKWMCNMNSFQWETTSSETD